jgi:PDZ domain-containing protein
MSRRSIASLVAVALLVVLLVAAARMPVPYVTVSPGPTVDVLGLNGDDPIVRVEGRRTYPTEGELLLTTVSVTNPDNRLSLLDALGGWMRRDVSVIPYEAMYPEPSTAEQERAESQAQMVSSQDTAIAAALGELGYDLPTFAEVTGVTPGGPSDGELKARDRIVRIDGSDIGSVEDVFLAMAGVTPGDTIEVEVRRGGDREVAEVTTTARDDNEEVAALGILVGTGYRFPFDVSVAIDESIGGPSAGLMFALSVYDTLTPGALSDGEVVAGTGTIDAEGNVGPIGGIQQKILGARDAGAEVFLVPPDNCAAALAAPVDEDEIRLVRADTMSTAVQALEEYAENPDADLPRCEQ